MFLDAAYVAKYYVTEPDSAAVRRAVQGADSLVSSAWSIVEVSTALRRHVREGKLTVPQFGAALQLFREHAESGIWTLVPVNEQLFWRTMLRMTALPAGVFLRAGDAVQLAAAIEAGEREIWSSDRHLLSAAPHFGLIARTA